MKKIINFDNEPQEKFSEEWWLWYMNLSFVNDCGCIIKNTKTKKIYVGDMYGWSSDKKASFYLHYDLNTKEKKNRHIIINYNNKGYHKVINFFY